MSAAAELETLTDLDHHFAEFINHIGGGEGSLIQNTTASLSRAVRDGHICLDLSKTETDQAKLLECSAIGTPDKEAPLILDQNGRLYLRRYWLYEKRLAAALLSKAKSRKRDNRKLEGTQKEAIARALGGNLTIITGGPGTGKTTTVLEILRQLIEKNSDISLRVALAAPTGKAAGRLEETLRAGIEKLPVSQEIKDQIPSKASTIHRLLGARSGGSNYYYNQRNPLPLDVLVIDEASMVALPLMTKLFDALPPKCRVVLLGDRDQLASVDPGAVLADIVDAAVNESSTLNGSVVSLTENFRFRKQSAIYRCSSAVRQGAIDDVLEILNEKSSADLSGAALPVGEEFQKRLAEAVTGGFSKAVKAQDPSTALKEFGRFRILCALRRGPFGVTGLNRRIEEYLRAADLISADSGEHYRGKPILITQNDYQFQLYNGDIGVLFPDVSDSDSSRIWAWFLGPDGTPRKFSPARLPEHDVAYAMTVHKAQGSEFDQVLFVLPDRDSAVLSRELIYTGITRARKKVEIWFKEEVLTEAIGRKAVRYSGLTDALLREAK